MNIQDALRVGDITREKWPQNQSEHVNLFLGSGRMGACFDAWGLMHNGRNGQERESQSVTTIMHADHWHRGVWGIDAWLPVARLIWDGKPPAPPEQYHQQLQLHDGALTTDLRWPNLHCAFKTTFHPQRRDVLAIEVSYDGNGAMPPLLLAPETQALTPYRDQLQGEARVLEARENRVLTELQTGSADSVIALQVVSSEGEIALESSTEGTRIRFAGARGCHLLLIGVASQARREELESEIASINDATAYFEEAKTAWRARWGESFIHVPEPTYQALWARSLYYVLSSYAPDVRSLAPPCGWSGNAWTFHFPQDVSYIHPALLRLGHHDIAQAWVEFYRGYLETMQEFTQRIYGVHQPQVEGAMWAWEFPIGPNSQLLKDGAPNPYQFEIHNAAYPARMAWETSRHLKNPQWTRDVAWPIVRESARFFASTLKKEGATWSLHILPSMGQDEMGGENAKNYFDALCAAQYCLQTAAKLAEEMGEAGEERARWQMILADGLAFNRLLDKEKGLCVSCEDLLGSPHAWGHEKHPVQLDPLMFLPLGELPEHVRRAYDARHELCADTHRDHYHGWTLASFWLAASHMGDASGLLHELEQARPAIYVDADWIQIYEGSHQFISTYYVTSHGLYLQALNDALLSDFWGETQIGHACPPAWNGARFHRLHTMNGETLSGELQNGEWQAQQL